MNEYDEGWVDIDTGTVKEEDLEPTRLSLLERMKKDMEIKRQMEDQMLRRRDWAPTGDRHFNYTLRGPVIRGHKEPGSHPRLRRGAVAVSVAFEAVDEGLSWLANRMSNASRWVLDRTETWGEHFVYDGMAPPHTLQYKPFETDTRNYPDPPEGMPF